MLGVLSGFSLIWVVILVGYLIGRLQILGNNAQQVLSRLSFFVASPALLLDTLRTADLRLVFSTPLLVAAVSAVATALLFLLAARLWLRRGTSETMLGAMSASMVNSANLGIPIAVYVLGDASHIAPILIFQLAIYTPLFLMVLDSTTSGRRTTPASFVVQILRNPMIIGSVIGLVLAGTGWEVPASVLEPIKLIGGAAVPAMLLAFGISLVGSRPLQRLAGRRVDVLLASGLKLAVQPVIAYLFGRFLLDLSGEMLFAVVVCAALPTAQNVFVAASRYRQGEVVAKDTVLLTTVIAVPAMLLIAAVLT